MKTHTHAHITTLTPVTHTQFATGSIVARMSHRAMTGVHPSITVPVTESNHAYLAALTVPRGRVSKWHPAPPAPGTHK